VHTIAQCCNDRPVSPLLDTFHLGSLTQGRTARDGGGACGAGRRADGSGSPGLGSVVSGRRARSSCRGEARRPARGGCGAGGPHGTTRGRGGRLLLKHALNVLHQLGVRLLQVRDLQDVRAVLWPLADAAEELRQRVHAKAEHLARRRFAQC